MTKVLSVLLVFMMLVSLSVCATAESDALPEPNIIGLLTTDPASRDAYAARANWEYIAKLTNTKVIYQSYESSPESIINGIESLISQGAQAIGFFPYTEDILPVVMSICDASGVFLGTFFRDIQSPEILQMCNASPYYVGRSYESEYNDGAALAGMLADSGYKTLACFLPDLSNALADTREPGVLETLAGFGVERVAEIRNVTDGTEVARFVESTLQAYPDLDLFTLISGAETSIPAMVNAIQQAGKTPEEIAIIACDFKTGTAEAFDAGYLKYAQGGHMVIDRVMCFAALVNAVTSGSRMIEDEGIVLTPKKFIATGSQDLEDYYTYIEGRLPIFTEEELKANVLQWYNPEITAESFAALANDFSVENIAREHRNLESVEGFVNNNPNL